MVDTVHCRICGRKADEEQLCKECKIHLDDGTDEDTLKRMYSDDRVKEIWSENKKLADNLAQAYYPQMWKTYKKLAIKDSKENFGFNTFAGGINMGLDITIPMVDDDTKVKINRKIADMLIVRKNKNAK